MSLTRLTTAVRNWRAAERDLSERLFNAKARERERRAEKRAKFWEDMAESYKNERGHIHGVRAHVTQSDITVVATLIEDFGGNILRLKESGEPQHNTRVFDPFGTQIWPLTEEPK